MRSQVISPKSTLHPCDNHTEATSAVFTVVALMMLPNQKAAHRQASTNAVPKTIGAVFLTSNRSSQMSFRRNGLVAIQHSKRGGVFAGATGFGLTSASTTLCEQQKLRTR